MDLTHLCINNVGAFNECYADYGIEKVREERYKITKQVAEELGLELIETDSNFAEAFPQNHLLTHTYSSCFAIFMLQKLWKIYYYASSGYDYSAFSLYNNDKKASGYYELLSLRCFSTRGMTIFSEGGEKTRLNKTENLLDYAPAQKHLHVCLTKPQNCNVCSKCRRTLVTLDFLNGLDKFSKVFDIDYYKKHKKEYYMWLYEQHLLRDKMNEPVYEGMKKRKEFRKLLIGRKWLCHLKVLYQKLRKKASQNEKMKMLYHQLKQC